MTDARFSREGWDGTATCSPSPNFDKRPAQTTIDLIVVHSISLPPGRYGGTEVADLFLNRLDIDADPYFAGLNGLRVSSHFFIRRDGELIQFVACTDRAWHAGVSVCEGRERCNDFSVGIELEGTDTDVFTSEQYRSLRDLCQALSREYPISCVAAHSDIAPGRKTDPGAGFDWDRFLAALVPRIRRVLPA